MQISDITLAGFIVFGSIRIFSYVPQIIRVAKDANGASAISYTTWSMWTLAHLVTASYAWVNLSDPYLAGVSCIYALCCALVLSLTIVKRSRHHQRHGSTRKSEDVELESIQATTRHLIAREAARGQTSLVMPPDFERRLMDQRNRYLRTSLKKWVSH